MSDPHPHQWISPRAIMAASAVVVFALVATTVGRFADVGVTRISEQASPAMSRELRFEDQENGSLAVLAADEGHVIHVVEPGTGGFVRGVLRGLGRDRKLRGMDQDSVYRLTRWEDGRLSFTDTATGVRIDLEPFGPTNIESFAVMLRSDSVAMQPNSQVSL